MSMAPKSRALVADPDIEALVHEPERQSVVPEPVDYACMPGSSPRFLWAIARIGSPLCNDRRVQARWAFSTRNRSGPFAGGSEEYERGLGGSYPTAAGGE
ncbi:hypothetical protein AXG93_4027s1090 [Marchantia polymorpha subsp. ruderalis]|uniref:Uncharacterized protein n=1 Tax=Marchantia polymorpha subsp. ruderalis TaxID=1480154 RepID=A0A176W5S5_MARPO|nr:hypothetical protein AXG93_4027s1090 [Marchantia polymorpha subsp. ruderalis]